MKVALVVLSTLVLTHSAALAETMLVSWEQNIPILDGSSCVATCERVAAVPVSAGALTVPIPGDPELYVCRALIPGAEQFGQRAGYNWNAADNSQPGCTIVSGGTPGWKYVAAFSCLCEHASFVVH
jgi:hypothetical protein